MEVFQHRCWLGNGSYGDVQLCEVSSQTASMLLGVDPPEAEQMPRPILIALKTWKQAHTEEKVMRIALREVQLLKAVSHPNIIKLHCAFRTPSGRVCMAFEYGGKSTHQLLETRFPHGIPQPLLQHLAFQLVHALHYLHSQKIVHRDVKPANILLDSAGVLRVCDFGFARFMPTTGRDDRIDTGDGGGSERLTPYVITRWYRSPEVLLGMKYGTPTDVWSLGCTLAELATGKPLLPGSSSLDQISRIAVLLGPLTPHMASRVAGVLHPPAAVELAAMKSAADVVDALRQRLGSWLAPGFLELLAACLRTDPWERPTAEELLRMPYFADTARLFDGTSLGPLYFGIQGGSGAPPPSTPPPQSQAPQSPRPPQPLQPQPSMGAVQSAKATPPQPVQCGHYRCRPHPPSQHHLYQQHRTHDSHQQRQQQQILHLQQERRAQLASRSGSRLPYSSSMSSSADASSISASASCGALSTSGAATATRSNASMSDSLYSNAVLGSSNNFCYSYCNANAGAMVCACHAEVADRLSDPSDAAVPLDKEPLPLSPAAVAAAQCSSRRLIGGASAPTSATGAASKQCACSAVANTAIAHLVDRSSGGRGGAGSACSRAPSTATCWSATAVAASSFPSFEPSQSQVYVGAAPAAPPSSEPWEATAVVSPPVGVSATAVTGGGVPTTAPVYTNSWFGQAHPSGLSREAAIRALAAAAAFVADDTAAAKAGATAAAVAAATAATIHAAQGDVPKMDDRKPPYAGVTAMSTATTSTPSAAVAAYPLPACPVMSTSMEGNPKPPQLPAAAVPLRSRGSGAGKGVQAANPCGVVGVKAASPYTLYNMVHANGRSGSSCSSSSGNSSNSMSGGGDSNGSRQLGLSLPAGNSPDKAGDIAAAAAASTAAFAAGAARRSRARQLWRPLAASALLEEDDIDENGDDDNDDDDDRRNYDSGYDGGSRDGSGCGDGDTARFRALATPVLSTHWLDSYYHDCSQAVTPAATGLAPPAVAAAATACRASTQTTMSFNWCNAESPPGGGHDGGGIFCAGGSTVFEATADGAELLCHTSMAGHGAGRLLRPPWRALLQQQQQQLLAPPPALQQHRERCRQRQHGEYIAASAGAVGGVSKAPRSPPPVPPQELQQQEHVPVVEGVPPPLLAGLGPPGAQSGPHESAAATAMTVRQPQQGAMLYCGMPAAVVAAGCPVKLSYTSVGGSVVASFGAAPGRGDGAESDAQHGMGATAVASSRPGPGRTDAAAPAVAVAATTVMAVRSAVVAAERRTSAAFTLDWASGLRSCSTSIGERASSTGVAEVGCTAAAVAVRGVRGSCSGRRVRGWLGKSRVWLRNMLEGALSGHQSQPR